MSQSNTIKLIASSIAIATLGLSAIAPASLAVEGVDVYVENSCTEGMTVWYEWIENQQVQGLQKVSIAPGDRVLIKTTPYRWFRAYAKVWSGGYEWEGSGRQYSIDGSSVHMREFDLNTVSDGTAYTIRYPCSNL
jgi:hypothetical protein